VQASTLFAAALIALLWTVSGSASAAEPPGKADPAKADPAKPPAAKLKVLLVSGSLEYESDKTLAAFQEYVEKRYPVTCRRAFRKTDTDIPGLVEGLADCDVVLLFTRRLSPAAAQLDAIKKYLADGGPVVGVRTASHAFQNWPELDREILGGNYKNHYGKGPPTELSLTDAGKTHPATKGFEPFKSAGTLYRNTGLAADATVLMNGSIPDHTEPVTWTRERKGLARNGRAFTTSLGHQRDFEEEAFRVMLSRALFWAAGRDVPEPSTR
jgi:type 1 glutamine amidotransferase